MGGLPRASSESRGKRNSDIPTNAITDDSSCGGTSGMLDARKTTAFPPGEQREHTGGQRPQARCRPVTILLTLGRRCFSVTWRLAADRVFQFRDGGGGAVCGRVFAKIKARSKTLQVVLGRGGRYWVAQRWEVGEISAMVTRRVIGGDVSLFANEQLLMAFRAGERDALDQVYRSHVGAVERYLNARGRSTAARRVLQAGALADIVQEIFFRAFLPRSRRAYDGVREYEQYLCAIARNCLVDAIRAGDREIPVAPEDIEIAVVTSGELALVDEPVVRAIVVAYLEELPEQLKQTYWQRFVLGHSQSKASTVMGLSRRQLRTAEQQLQKGLRRALVAGGVRLSRVG